MWPTLDVFTTSGLLTWDTEHEVKRDLNFFWIYWIEIGWLICREMRRTTLTLYKPPLTTPLSKVINVFSTFTKHILLKNSTATRLLANSFEILSKFFMMFGAWRTWLSNKGSEVEVSSKVDPICLISNAFSFPINKFSWPV